MLFIRYVCIVCLRCSEGCTGREDLPVDMKLLGMMKAWAAGLTDYPLIRDGGRYRGSFCTLLFAPGHSLPYSLTHSFTSLLHYHSDSDSASDDGGE